MRSIVFCSVAGLMSLEPTLRTDHLVVRQREETYQVSGQSLTELADALRESRRASEGRGGFDAYTRWTLHLPPAPTPCRLGDLKLQVSIVVTLPVISRDTELSDADRLAWNAFAQALSDHEDEHLRLIRGELAAFSSRLGSAPTCGRLALETAMLDRRILRASALLDARTGHGANSGASLERFESRSSSGSAGGISTSSDPPKP
ncbi:MAG: DUF922 domain-containing protein [Brevundimonas sp.]|nr:MAG: DUF922 domain-containing protein [Brevundimonas sp.]